MRNVRKFTAKLATLGAVGAALVAAAPAMAGEGLGVTSTFGGLGAGPGQLSDPAGVAVNDVTGDVYVADLGNDRIEVFDSEGKYLSELAGFPDPGEIAVDNSCFLRKLTTTECEKDDPSNGDVYVAESKGHGAHVIDKFSATGTLLFQLDTGSPLGIPGIAIDPSGDVWVIDRNSSSNRNQAQEYNDASENTQVPSVGVPLEQATGLAVDSEDNLYVIEPANYAAVRKFNTTGTTLGVVCEKCSREPEREQNGLAVDPANNDLFVDTGSELQQYGPFGEPFGVPIDVSKPDVDDGGGVTVNPTTGEVYVAEDAGDDVAVFSHGPLPETPETLEADSVTTTTAMLHGNLSPHSPPAKLEYFFEYNTGGTCTGGLRTPLKHGGEGDVSEEVTGLEPGGEYTYCLVSENNFGPSEPGPRQSFDTLSAAPEVIGESAANPESGFLVQFAAVVNPEHSKQETTYFAEYSTEGSVEHNTLTGTVETASGESAIPPEEYGPQTVTSAGTFIRERSVTLYYRIVVTNETGTTVGKVQAYTKLPIVGSEGASGLTLTEAILEAKVNPDWQETEYHFEYATGANAKRLVGEGKGTQLPTSSVPGGGFEFNEDPVSVVVSGLSPDTLYYYRVVAENESTRNPSNADKGEPVDGKVEEFTTRSLPFVSTGAAQSITRTSVTLSGTLTPLFVNATYYFAYIDQAGYEKALAGDAQAKADPYTEGETTIPIAIGANESAQAIGPIPAGGLLPGTTYHYVLAAKNEFGVEYGEGHTFTTLTGTPPTVSTGGASAISQNAATLSGTVATNGLQTNYGFEIGTEPGNYGPATGLGSIGGATTQAVSVTLGELQPGTTYYYRVTGTNADGTVQGEPATFTTPAFPVLLATTPSLPLLATPAIAFPREEPASGTVTTPKSLTKAEKLAAALRRCKKDRARLKRVACEKAAKQKYRPPRKKTGKK